jgi:pimeloyl-ACP methyl ester carboxylesterase
MTDFVVTPTGARLRVRAFGSPDAPIAILALHGFGQTADYLEPFATAVTRSGRVYVVAPDLRSHGDSDDFPPTGTADDVFVADAHAIWSARIGRPAVWFGNSLGARIAALTTAAHPEVASALVLGECLAGLERNWKFLLAGARQLAAKRPASFATRDEARAYALGLRGVKRDVDVWLAHGLRALAEGGFVDKLRLDLVDQARWPERPGEVERALGTLAVAVTLLYAERSAIPEAQQRVVQGFIPGATLEHLDGAGHDLYLDVPELLADRVCGLAIAGSNAR